MRGLPISIPALFLWASACAPGAGSGGEGQGEGGGEAAGLPGGSDTQPFSAIGAAERLHFVGTEPFWAGDVAEGRLTYSTPEQPDGTALPVERFAGRGGLSFNGALAGSAFDMAVTQGACSDGMSDRTYPFSITLRIGADLRYGCGWTDAKPFGETPPR